MTKTRDLERSQNEILDGAEACFVAKGFAGASMSEIAKASGVTQSLIHYHFNNKANLWNEVKRRRLKVCFETIERFEFDSSENEESILTSFIKIYFDVFRENPGFSRLIGWQGVSVQGKTDSDSNAIEPEEAILKDVMAVIKKYQKSGIIRKDIDAPYLVISLFSLITGWFQSKEGNLQRKSFALKARKADDEYLNTIVKIFLQGALAQ